MVIPLRGSLFKVEGSIPGQLRVLDLDWSILDDNDLATLANIPELRVKELSLAGCYNISSRGLADYCLQVGPKLLERLVSDWQLVKAKTTGKKNV